MRFVRVMKYLYLIKFNDFNFDTADAALLWVDSLYVKYDIPHRYKEALKTLAIDGEVDVPTEQSTIILNILKKVFQLRKRYLKSKKSHKSFVSYCGIFLYAVMIFLNILLIL